MAILKGGFHTCNDDTRRANKKNINGLILGEYGRGKTSLLWTLPAHNTLFVDAENSSQVIAGWKGVSQRVRTWQDCQILALMLAQEHKLPESGKSDIYTVKNLRSLQEKYADRGVDQFRNVFIDSMTSCTELCFLWASANCTFPRGAAAKDINLEIWQTFTTEFTYWLKCIYSGEDKNIWSTALLTCSTDDGVLVNNPHLRSRKMASTIMAANDEVFTMIKHVDRNGAPARVFVCKNMNSWDYPAKDRSGGLEVIEQAHLGHIIEKINATHGDIPSRLEYADL